MTSTDEQALELFTRLSGGHLHSEDGLDGGACIVFDLPLEIHL